MRHRKDKKTLGRKRDSRRLLTRSLASQLLQHGTLTTTLTKGKVAQRQAERMITIGSQDDLAHLRQLVKLTGDPALSKKIIKHIAPKYATRNGGYTRLIRLNQRAGDGAHMVHVSLVE